MDIPCLCHGSSAVVGTLSLPSWLPETTARLNWFWHQLPLRWPASHSTPRDSGIFSGTDGKDAEDWIRLHERGTNNRWDPTVMLANVVFYLVGTPRVWLRTHEDELTSWDMLKQKFWDLFGNPHSHQLATKKALSSRVLTSRKPYVTWIQQVLALCRKVDARDWTRHGFTHSQS